MPDPARSTPLTRLRHHVVTNVVAYAALFVALGGTSYAAAELAPNSVGTAQLKTGAVTATKIHNNAITAAKIKDGTLKMKDFAPGQLRIAVKTAKGPAGPQGPAGPAGATKVATRTVSGTVGSDARYMGTAVCQTDERAVGGGAYLSGTAHTWDHLLSSRPGVTTTAGGFGANSNTPGTGDTPNAWTAEMYSAVSGRTLNVYVICAAP